MISHTGKIFVRFLSKRLESKIKEATDKDQFGSQKDKGTRDAIGLMRIISKRVLEVKEEMCLCFIDCQKAFDCADWTTLLEMLRNIKFNWRKRQLIRNLYMGQRVKLRLNRGETENVEIGRGVRQGCCMSSILFNTYGEYLMKEALAEVEGFKIWRRIMNKVRFADDTAIIAKTQKALQDSVNRLVDTGRKYGMEINIDKSQVIKVSRSNE